MNIIKYLFLLCISAFLCLYADAQELQMKQFELDPTMTDAVKYPVQDDNGKNCGLIRIGFPHDDADISGNGIVLSRYKVGEWWVYMKDGSRSLTIKKKGYEKLPIRFPEPIRSNCTYVMTVSEVRVHVINETSQVGQTTFENISKLIGEVKSEWKSNYCELTVGAMPWQQSELGLGLNYAHISRNMGFELSLGALSFEDSNMFQMHLTLGPTFRIPLSTTIDYQAFMGFGLGPKTIYDNNGIGLAISMGVRMAWFNDNDSFLARSIALECVYAGGKASLFFGGSLQISWWTTLPMLVLIILLSTSQSSIQ